MERRPAPFVSADDDLVLESGLPITDLRVRQMRAVAAQLRQRPDDLELAMRLASRQHDFAPAATELRAVLQGEPHAAQALLESEGIDEVTGDLAESKDACAKPAAFHARLAAACAASIGSLTGAAEVSQMAAAARARAGMRSRYLFRSALIAAFALSQLARSRSNPYCQVIRTRLSTSRWLLYHRHSHPAG